MVSFSNLEWSSYRGKVWLAATFFSLNFIFFKLYGGSSDARVPQLKTSKVYYSNQPLYFFFFFVRKLKCLSLLGAPVDKVRHKKGNSELYPIKC